MIDNLLRFSIRFRGIILLITLVFAAFGGFQLLTMPIDAVPDITNKQVVINASIDGLGPEEVERQVTFPLEVALAGTPHLTETRSISQYGLSQVTVVFEDQTDLYFARQVVSERLNGLDLPLNCKVEIGPVSTGLGELVHLKIDNPDLSLRQRRELMDWVVRPQLLRVPGLAEINPWGGTVRQLQIAVDPTKLEAAGLTIRDVSSALAQNHSNASGSYLKQSDTQALVRSVGTLTSKQDLEQTPIKTTAQGRTVRIADVALVSDGDAIRQGAFTDMGTGEQVYCIALLLIGENGKMVMNGLRSRITTIEKTLPAGTKLIGFLERDHLIDRTLETALKNLSEGGILVIAVLLLFLLQIRAGLIVSSVIPVAMLIAAIGMRAFHISANLMSLGALDFGLLVDGAVIIVENAVRQISHRVSHASRKLSPHELDEVLFQAAKEVMQPSLFGVAIIIATYIPILSLQGVEGKMFRPMGLTVILALIASILLSLTWVPALCRQFLKSQDERPHPVLDRIESGYKHLLSTLLDRPIFAIAPALALMAVSGFLFTRLGSSFIPELDEGAIAVSGFYKAGTSLDEVIARSTKLEQVLLAKFPDEISHVMNRIGRPEVATDPMLIHQTDTLISLHPTNSWKRVRTKDALISAISDVLQQSPGFDATFTQPVKMRMDEMIQGQGLRSDLGIKVFGPDIEKLADLAREIATTVAGVSGAADVEVEATEGLPQLQIMLDRERMGRLGVDVEAAQAVVESALAGHKAVSIVDGTRKVDVTVRLNPDERSSVSDVMAIRIPTHLGTRVSLVDIADIERVSGPIQVSRENGQRRVVIMANVRGRDLGTFAEDVQQKVNSSIKLPIGYSLEYAGTYEQLKSGKLRLMIAVPITFIAVFILLMLTLGNFKHALLVFTGIPFAVSGGILALTARQMPFSISAGVGFIALAGIAVLNGLVMVTFITSIRSTTDTLRDAVITGAQARIRPVLMTACVASLGFVPMAIATGSGAEVQKPIATVVIGGLITATVLTLVVLPVIFRMIHKRDI